MEMAADLDTSAAPQNHSTLTLDPQRVCQSIHSAAQGY